jgi:hypothetical protein
MHQFRDLPAFQTRNDYINTPIRTALVNHGYLSSFVSQPARRDGVV